MRTLVTGITGSIGTDLAPALLAAGHQVRGFTRDARRVRVPVDDVVEGDATTGRGLDAALDGVDVAYYLIHSMEAGVNGFDAAELRAAETFARAARDAGVGRIVYLGGLVPDGAAVRNPAFDVTPHRYVTAIVTDRGVVHPPFEPGLAGLA